MAVSENLIRTVIEIIDKGALGASQRIEKIHAQLLQLRTTEAERGKGYTGMRGALDKYARQTEEVAKTHGELAAKQKAAKKAGQELSDEEKRTYNETAIQMGRYQKDLKGTVTAKQKFREELTRAQKLAKAYPQDIRNWTAQKSLLNRAYQQGTITMATYKKKIEPVNKELDNLQKGQGRNIIQAAKWAVMWFVLYRVIRTVVGGVTSVIRIYGDLENEMARVSTVTRTMGETKKETMGKLRDAVLKYGATSIRSFKEIAEAMYHLGSAGLTVSQQLAGFEHILALTTGTMGNITQVARLVAGSFNVYGKQLERLGSESEKFKYISDLLAYTYSIQQVELSEIANAMTYVASAGALLDIDFKVLIGTIGELNTGMLKGSRAGTSLMNAFIQLAQNSDKLGQLLGVTFNPDRPLDFVNIMDQLHDRFGDTALTTAGLKDLMQVFGMRGARAVGEIINRFREWKKTISVTDATFENFAKDMEKTIQDTLPRQLKILGNVIYKELVEGLTPALETLKANIKYLYKTIDLEKEISELSKYYGESKVFIADLDEETIRQLYKRVILGEEITKQTDEWLKEIKEITPEQHAINRALIEGKVITRKRIDDITKEVSLAGDLTKLQDELNKKKEKGKTEEDAKNRLATEKATIEKIKEISKEKERTIRIAELELFTAAEYLITNEKILDMYEKARAERTILDKKVIENLKKQGFTEEQILKYKDLSIAGQEILNGLEEWEIRLLREAGFEWETIQKIIIALAERDMPNMVNQIEKQWRYSKEIEKLRFRGAAESTIAYREALNVLEENWEIIKETTRTRLEELEAIGIQKELLDTILDSTNGLGIAQQIIKDIIKGQNIELWKMVLGAKAFQEAVNASMAVIKKMPLENLLNQVYDIGEAITKGWVSGTLEWANTAQQVFDAVGEYARTTITDALTGGIPTPFGGLIGGIAGGLISGLGALIFGGGKKEQEKIKEATLDVSAGVDISNEQLAIINRNLLDIRHVMEGYIMPESYYFRQRVGGMGVQVQGGIHINMPEGSSGSDVVQAIEESFGLAGSRVYQPS